MRVTRVRVENFRCLRQVDLELSPLTVIIGPNGAGKSSLLQAVAHLGRVGNRPGHLTKFMSYCGGFPAALSYYAKEPTMRVGATMRDDSDALHYDIELRGEGAGFFVSSERLRRQSRYDHGDGELFERRDTMVSLLSSQSGRSTGQVPHGNELSCFRHGEHLPDATLVLAGLQRISRYKAYRFQPGEPVRRPQQLQPTVVPLNDGTDLFAALYSMQTDRPDLFGELLSALRKAVPTLDTIDFPLAGGGGHVDLRWVRSDLPKPLYANQLSDGTLRLLWLLTVLHTVPDDGLILLDEPELSLHPQWLLLLVSVARSMSARTTVVLATQSAELVRWVEPDELVVADLGDDGATLSRVGDRKDMQEWLKDFMLDELWTMGELGGRR